MKKVIFAAMMALSCTFAFAGTNPVQPETQPVQQESNVKNDSEKPEWVLILMTNGDQILVDNGCSGLAIVQMSTAEVWGCSCCE